MTNFTGPTAAYRSRTIVYGVTSALDGCFVHRSRTIEGKDGNPLNEVRMLCNSILQHRGVLTADKTIKANPSKSILKRQVRDEIKLTEADCVLLCTAFFAEIEKKFV
jgi:hypothetical protein